MQIHRATLDTCDRATGTVVVIDVLPAMINACYAFKAGAEAIILVAPVEEAFAIRRRYPGMLMIGEVDGLARRGPAR